MTRLAEKQLTTSSAIETEPVIVTYLSGSGVEYYCSVWMHFSPDLNAYSSLRAGSWRSTSSIVTNTTIPQYSTYNRMADPILLKHPTLERIYLVALGQDTSTGTFVLLVWFSNSGGSSWSTPTVIPTEGKFDKPAAAFAPDGTLWVSYVRQPGTTNTIILKSVTHNADFTWTFGSPIVVDGYTIPNIPGAWNTEHNPQVMSDGANGVYLSYTAYDQLSTAVRVRLAHYFLNGTITKTDVPSVTRIYTGQQRNDYLEMSPGVTLRAGTVPIAKIDRIRRRIIIVWHEPSGAMPGPSTKIRMAVYRVDAAQWAAWPSFSVTTGRELFPAFDIDPNNGNLLVTWYRFSANQSTYLHVGKYVTFSGDTPTWTTDDVISNQGPADLSLLTPDSIGDRYIGDYHDVMYTNGAFRSVQIRITGANGNPWAFTVAP
ncbi:MAG TPA: hypothetical protein VJZ00_14940 [Thermoanaerobaculia bacterium]|nr:hypothetical protein [Thermoanaerobaculia bacterium]